MIRPVGTGRDASVRLAHLYVSAFPDRETRWTSEDFRRTNALVLADDGIERGLIIVQFASDQGEIIDLGVIPSARRQGFGRELLSTAEADAADIGIARMSLEVAVDNAPAQALYLSAGYRPIGRRKAYYLRADKQRIDALVLGKELPAGAPDGMD